MKLLFATCYFFGGDEVIATCYFFLDEVIATCLMCNYCLFVYNFILHVTLFWLLSAELLVKFSVKLMQDMLSNTNIADILHFSYHGDNGCKESSMNYLPNKFEMLDCES